MAEKKELPILAFESQAVWKAWLSKHADTLDGLWIRFYKKASGVPTVTYREALDEALCYGWIDGQVKRFDELSYIQRFTPRRKRSNWSKINTEHVSRLMRLSKMKPRGLLEVEKAKEDGRWDRAYESPSTMKVPEDFLYELSKHKKAEVFFLSLNKANKFAIAYQLKDAKRPETRQRRLKKFLDMMNRGEKLY